MKKMQFVRMLALAVAALLLCGAVMSGCTPAEVNDESTTEALDTTEEAVDTTDTESEAVSETESESESVSETESEPESESVSETDTLSYWDKTHIDLVNPVEETVHITLEGVGQDVYKTPNQAPSGHFGYAYGPTYLYNEDGSIDVWYAACSNFMTFWDCIGYVHSDDGGQTWSMPQIVLYNTPNSEDNFSTCDPGVVYFNGYYYIGYTSTMCEAGLCNNVYVARSKYAAGPYEKWNGTGWGGEDPKALFYYDQPNGYFGIGEPSFVELNGTLYIYYELVAKSGQYYMLATADATDENWPLTMQNQGTVYVRGSNEYTDSIDIKYVEDWGKFVGVATGRRMTDNGYIAVFESSDGLSFDMVDVVREGIFPGCHNAGISSRANGRIRLSEDADRLHVGYAYCIDEGWNMRAQPIAMTLTQGNDMEAEKEKPCYDGEISAADDVLTEKIWNHPVMIAPSEDTYYRTPEDGTFQVAISARSHLFIDRNIMRFCTFDYQVEDESVVTIDENGLVTIHGLGETRILVTVTGENREVGVLGFRTWIKVKIVEEVSVYVPDSTLVKFEPVHEQYVISMNEKDIYTPQLRAILTQADGKKAQAYVLDESFDGNLGMTFTGYDDTVISVDSRGVVKALAVGETDVTVSCAAGMSFTVHIVVTDDPTQGFFRLDKLG